MDQVRTWRVHTWHISVPIGDSAIHLLVDEGPGRVVYRAVLVDGGKSRNKATASIQKIIGFINREYAFADNENFEGPYGKGKSLRFDAIVITHWDSDHYEGVFGILQKGFEESLSLFGRHPPLHLSDFGKFDAIDIPCFYCKYSFESPTSAPLTSSLTPQTWEWTDATSKAKAAEEFMSKYRNHLRTTIYCPYAVDLNTLGPFGNKGDRLRPNFASTFDRLRTDHFASFAVGGNKYLPNLANLVAHWDHYIGVDIFTGASGTNPTSRRWIDVNSPAVLVDWHAQARSAERPGLFVIAGDQRVIGNTTLVGVDDVAVSAFSLPGSRKAVGTHSVSHLIAHSDSSLGTAPGDNVARIDDGVPKNASSIVTMTIAATGSIDPHKSFEILHYNGGDVLWDVEGAIAKWLVDELRKGDDNKQFYCTTKAMKLSHHGSKYTTAIQLLNALHPDYFIVSCPKGKSFGHPHSEIVMMIHAHRQLWMRIDVEKKAATSNSSTTTTSTLLPPLFCTHFPPWVTESKNYKKAPNLDSLLPTPTDQPAAQFQLALNQRWDPANNMLLDYQKKRSKSKPDFVTIANIVEDLWSPGLSLNVHPDNPDGQLAGWGFRMGMSNGQPVVSICSLDTNEKPLERVAYAKIESPFKLHFVVNLTGDVIIRIKRSRDESSSSTRPTPTEPVSKAHKPDDPSGSTTIDEDEDNNYNVDDHPYADPEANFVGLVKTTSTPFHLHSSVLHLDEGKRLPVIAGRPSSSSLLVVPSTSPALIEPSFPESLRPAVDIQPVRSEESTVPHFFLFSSDFDQSITNRPRAFLAKGTAFDEFVLTLSDGYIIVERHTDAPFDTDHSVIVSTGDKWGQSVTLGSGLGISKITLTLKIDQHEVATVSSWQAEIGAGSGTISFKSDDAPAILGADLQDKVLVLEEYGLGILGLSEELTDMTLPQVAGLFGQTWLTDKSFDTNPLVPIDTISNLVKFKLSKNKNSRSGLYFRADDVSTTYLRLQFDLTNATNELLTWLRNEHLLPSKSADSIVIENFAFTLLKTSTTTSSFSRWMAKVTDKYTLSGSIKFGEATDSPRIQFWLAFEPKNVLLVLRFPKLSIEQIFGWLRARFSFAEQTDNSAATQKLEPGAVTGLVPQDDVSVSVRQVEVQIGGPSNFHCTVVLQLEVFGTVFMTSLAFPALHLRADLWTQKPVTDQRPRWVPWYESYKEFSPYDSEALTGSLNLKTLVKNSGDKSNLPEPPHHSMFDLREAYFEAAKPASGQLHLELFAKVYMNPPDGDIPMVWPKSFEVFGAYDKTTSGASWIIALSTTLTLTSRNPTVDSVKPALLALDAAKTNDSWIFTGHAENLDFGAMYKYFDVSARDGVMDILEGIGIPYLDVEYVHGPSKKLTANGAFKIKKFLLLFDYTYEKLGAGIGKGKGTDTGASTGVGAASTSTWKLHAALGPSMEMGKLTSTVTLLDVISEFVPGDDAIISILGEVPFVSDIEIKTADSSSGNKPMEFEVSSTAKALVMWLRMEVLLPVGTLSLMFVQYKYKPAATGTGAARPPKTQDLKRYIRVRLDKLPDLPKIPIVGQIKQPVDAIDYVFVQDSTTTGGLTQAEISEINQSLPRDSTVRFKQADSQIQAQSEQNFRGGEASAEKSAGVSLRCGHHFIVITDDKVVLDHVFGGADSQKPTPPPKPTAALAVPGDLTLRREVEAPKGEASETDSGATFGPNKKSMGALSISNVGLQVKDKYLFILLDAKIKLGTIEMTIEGFGIGLPLAKITKPKDITVDDFKATLTGLGVMYNQPPILIAGGFKHEETDKYESYMGGLLITIPPYSIMAVGAYRRTFSPDFKSVFLFGRLDGPLFTLEFAEISGVAVSFGYNYNLRSPRGSDIENFPLLSKQQNAGAGDPLDMIIGTGPSSFGSWLTAQKDMNFFSIGLKADALQVLTIETALIFGIGVDQFKISIVGRATAVLPPSKTKGSKPPLTFLYAELGLVATLDITGGSLIVEAQLSSNSYILSPACNLRGGFALCYWFGNSHYAGDWVFSVGGYHPAYKPPPRWPVPPRVGISWELSSVLRVSGEGFFAITPKAIMGGGRLLATFQAGPIFADFEAYASFLINFKPFFFVAEIGVRISVGARIHIGIITISISGSVSADLFLQGPPFGGYVNVDFKILHIKIKFGNSDSKPKALDWSGFLEAVRKPGLTGAPEAGNQKGKDTPDIVVIALSAGAATETLEKYSQATGEPWAVRAGSFRFRVESKVAIGVGVIDSGLKNEQPGGRKDDQKPIYARLTQSQTPLESTLTVKVELPDKAETDTGNVWRVLPIVKALPKALWDKYTTSEDPTASNGGDNQIGSILTNNGPQDTTIPHVVGYNFIPPKPTLPTLSLPSFNAVTAMSEGVFQQAEPPMGATLVRNPLLPPPKPNEDDVEMRPRLSVSAEGEGMPKLKEWWIEDAKGELTKWDAEKEWEAVKEAWGKVDGGVQGLTDIVVGAFGWASPVGNEEKKDDGAAGRTGDGGATSSGAEWVAGSGDGAKTGSPTAAPPLLSGAKPTALLKEFEKYYMSCPWVTVI